MPDVGTVFRDVEIRGVQNFGVFVEILPGLQVRKEGRKGAFFFKCHVFFGGGDVSDFWLSVCIAESTPTSITYRPTHPPTQQTL